MFRDDELRKIEVKQPDGSWLEVHMGNLQKGDVVRMFEPDGRPVVCNGIHEITVLEQPRFISDNGDESEVDAA
jgi:hypothetical protein